VTLLCAKAALPARAPKAATKKIRFIPKTFLWIPSGDCGAVAVVQQSLGLLNGETPKHVARTLQGEAQAQQMPTRIAANYTSRTKLIPLPSKGAFMSPSHRRFLRITGTLCLAVWLAGCGKKEAAPDSAASAAAPASAAVAPPPARVYVVGTDAAYAPFESQNDKGEIVGFDIDVVGAVAQKAGIEVKFVNTPWEGIFNSLNQGDRDLLVSAITITDERKQTMDFSAPYFDAQQLIAVKGDSKVAAFADLKKLKIGVQTGTTGDEVVTKLLGKNSTAVKRFESTPLALKELEAGGVDAVVADNGVVNHYVANNAAAKFKTVSDTAFAPEQYGLAVKKGNAELLGKLNKGLADIKADGSYDKIYAKYFGAAPKPAAPAASAASQ
jgi:polar amino acid transport system substrate-binding protein